MEVDVHILYTFKFNMYYIIHSLYIRFYRLLKTESHTDQGDVELDM